jgi:hypothetical protein
MPRCTNCGTVATDEAHFCPRCGSSMAAPAAAEVPLASAPPPPPPPYAQPQQPYYGGLGPAPRTNGMAVASLVLGIIWLFWVGSILALVFGYVGKGQIDRSGGAQSGRGLAIAGIVLGWVGVGTLVLTIVLAIIGSLNDSGSSQQALALLG